MIKLGILCFYVGFDEGLCFLTLTSYFYRLVDDEDDDAWDELDSPAKHCVFNRETGTKETIIEGWYQSSSEVKSKSKLINDVINTHHSQVVGLGSTESSRIQLISQPTQLDINTLDLIWEVFSGKCIEGEWVNVIFTIRSDWLSIDL